MTSGRTYVWHKRDDLPWGMSYRNDFIRGRPFPPVNFLKVVQETIGSVIESSSSGPQPPV